MTEIYRAENITKTFGHGKHEVKAVRDVSFSLDQGEVTTIVGECGSGKSTVARMVLGLMPITSGKLIFQDWKLHDIGAQVERVLQKRRSKSVINGE